VIFLGVGLLVAVAAAARSTYSPCGLSMLSSITPFGERARQHRYGVTAGWFVAGAVVGGATLGAVSAGLAAVVGGFSPTGPWRLAVGAALAAAAALIDAGAFGPILPLIRRQVDDRWLARYRPWVYAGGFGWQVGVGFATYLMTAGVALVVGLGLLSGSPLVAWCLGVLFGLARGGTVFLTAAAASPVQLRALHRRLDALGPAVRRGVIGLQGGVAVGLAASAWMTATQHPLGLGALVAVLAGLAGALAGAGLATRRAAARAGTSVVP
jgi:hypothetical protein